MYLYCYSSFYRIVKLYPVSVATSRYSSNLKEGFHSHHTNIQCIKKFRNEKVSLDLQTGGYAGYSKLPEGGNTCKKNSFQK